MSQLPAVISNLVNALEKSQHNTPSVSSSDFLYLKMSKAGEWVYGADETEVSADSVFIIDPSSYAQGYVAWNDGELVNELMAAAGQTPVTMSDLPDLPAGVKWDAQVAFALKGLEGEVEDLQFLYKVSSRGGKQVIAELLAKIIERGKDGEMALCPVILLDKTSYKHKKYGKIFTPVLTVDEWMDLPEPGEPEPAAQVEATPEPEPKPTRQRAKAKVEPEAEPDPKPTRQRRSRRSA